MKQRLGVVAALLEHRFHGHLLQAQRQHRVQRVALLQRARQSQDLAPVLQMLMRAQCNTLHVDLAATLFLQLGDRRQAPSASRASTSSSAIETSRACSRSGSVTCAIQASRRSDSCIRCATGAHQRGGLRLLGPRLGFMGSAFGTGKTSREQILDRLAHGRLRLAHAAALAIGGGTLRHLRQMPEGRKTVQTMKKASSSNASVRFSDISTRYGG
jgi:hypothetical protein